MDTAWIITWVIGIVIALWVAFSVEILEPNEIGGVYYFNKYSHTIGPGGLHFIWRLWYKLIKFPTGGIELDIPAKPEDVHKGSDKALPEGKMPPIRINHESYKAALFFPEVLPDKPKDKDLAPTLSYNSLSDDEKIDSRKSTMPEDPLSQALTSEIEGMVIWHIDPKNVNLYVKNTESIKDTNSRLLDVLPGIVQNILGKQTMREVNRAKKINTEKIQKELQLIVGEGESKAHDDYGEPWGIIIDNFVLKPLDPGETINKAMAAAAAAIAERANKVLDAEAEAKRIAEIGEAQAKATLASGTAKAEVVRLMAEALSDPIAMQARSLEVLERGFSNPGAVIFGDSALALVAGASKLLEKKK